MPYSGKDDDSLPSHVKEMDADKRAQWVEVFNSAMADCMDDDGTSDDCESSAFAQANGAVKRMTNKLREIWENFKAMFEAEIKATETTNRAIGWDQISEQVYKAARDMYPDCYPWLTGFYQDEGQTFVVISHEGRLYKHMVTIAADMVMISAGELVEVEFNPVGRATINIIRQADGRIRGVGIVATSVLNRVGEIDSRALFDSFIDHWRESGDNPILEFYHLGEKSRMGEIDYLARDENVYINSWLFDDNEVGRAAARSLEDDAEYWGFSIGYDPTESPEMMRVAEDIEIPVYNRGIHKETSIVARERAANLFTMPLAGVERMNEQVKADLKKLMGDNDELATEAETLIDAQNRAIEENGLITRSEDDATLTITDADGNVTTVTATPEVELDDAALEAIARTVENGEQFAALAGNVATLTETVTVLAATVEALSKANETANAETQRRLKAIEAEEDEKRREWQQDLPRKQTLRVTHRPRLANNVERGDDDGEQPETMADRAAKTLEKIPQRY